MADFYPFELIGVLHLPPLPGAPRNELHFERIVSHALRDAAALVEGGVQTCVIENFGDAPFRSGTVAPHVPAMLAVVGDRVRAEHDIRIGINVLRNDALAAMGAALASDASFIRVNVLTGSAWTDQGLIEGRAAELLRYRRALCGLGTSPRIFADINVKHAVPAGNPDIAHAALETVERGGADGVIVTGSATGAPTDLQQVRSVCEVIQGRPVWVGSGVTVESVRAVAKVAQGAIVGTALHMDGNIMAPIDKDRVRSMVEAARS